MPVRPNSNCSGGQLELHNVREEHIALQNSFNGECVEITAAAPPAAPYHHPPKSFQQWSNRHPALAQKISLPENFAFWPQVIVQPETPGSCQYQQQQQQPVVLPATAESSKLLLQQQLMQHRLLQKTRQSTIRKANVKPYYLPPFQAAGLLPNTTTSAGAAAVQVPTCSSGEVYNHLYAAAQPPPTIAEDEAVPQEGAEQVLYDHQTGDAMPASVLMENGEAYTFQEQAGWVEGGQEGEAPAADHSSDYLVPNPEVSAITSQAPGCVTTASLPSSPSVCVVEQPVWKPMPPSYNVEALPSYMAHSCRLDEEEPPKGSNHDC